MIEKHAELINCQSFVHGSSKLAHSLLLSLSFSSIKCFMQAAFSLDIITTFSLYRMTSVTLSSIDLRSICTIRIARTIIIETSRQNLTPLDFRQIQSSRLFL